MAVLSKEARLARLERLLDPENRFVEIAIQFEEVRRSEEDDTTELTGRRSRIFGGILDTWAGEYTDEEPQNPVLLPASGPQIDILEDFSPLVLVVGARGGGKSEAAKTKSLALMADIPGVNGQIVAPTHKLTRVLWGKILADLPSHWIYEVKRSNEYREILLINGVTVRFVSADNPDSLRGWGGAWSIHDEDQDQADDAHDNALLSLREAEEPHLCGVGTAKKGVFRDRYERMEEDPNASIHHVSALDNPFIPRRIYEIAKRSLDPTTYRQEVLSEWVAETDVVYPFFDKKRHMRRWSNRRAVLSELYGVEAMSPEVGDDITKAIVLRRFKWRSDVIVGLDYNISPMVAVVYRIAQGPAGVGDIMWLVGEVILDERADALRMGIALKRAGYKGALIVADASDSRARHYRRVLTSEGFHVVNPSRNNKNPDIKDRVAAFNAMLLNANDDTRWFCDPSVTRTPRAIERQRLAKDGKPDKSSGDDHYCDGAGYPITKLYPVAGRVANLHIKYAA